jgi:hypothetical protein
VARTGTPYPVPIKVYDETIRVMKSAVRNAKLGRDEEMQALNRVRIEDRSAHPPHPAFPIYPATSLPISPPTGS